MGCNKSFYIYELKKQLGFYLLGFIILTFLANCGGGGGGGGGSSSDDSLARTAQGKLAQGYVEGAQIWYDLKESDGLGNFQRDPGEPDTLSSSGGSYLLQSLQGEGVLITNGGSYRNHQGQLVTAAPMLAPAPSENQSATNITPVTTLVAAEPTIKEKLSLLGDWNADIADPGGTSAPLLRIAKTVEALSALLRSGEEPITLSASSNLRAIMTFAEKLANSPQENLADEATLADTSAAALDQVLNDSSIVRALGENVKDAVKASMSQLVTAITSEIPASGSVIESEVVENIEGSLTTAQSSIQDVLDQQVTISLGGFEFDPIIIQIVLQFVESELRFSAEVEDERMDTLTYRWSTLPTMVVQDPFSETARIENFDNNSLTVILQVTDDTDTNTTEVCAWDNKSNPKICNFLSN